MFELSKTEFENLRSQNVTSSLPSEKAGWGGARIPPMAFTEQGVSMLSSVLSSEKAIQINIEIMRTFSKYRAILKGNDELREEVKLLDKKLNDVFKYLLDKIDALHQTQKEEKPAPIGYKIKDK